MKCYILRFMNNMSSTSRLKVSDKRGEGNWTRITFKPDFQWFDMDHFEDDVVCLMRKRVYDMAGVLTGTNLNVRLDYIHAVQD